MIYSVLRRTLRDGVTFDQFREAWTPRGEAGDVDFTVIHAASVANPREILSIGTHDMTVEQFTAWAATDELARVNPARHDRIAPLLEGDDHGGFLGAYELLEGDPISL